MTPLAIDLYCGLGGWAEGFLAEGFDVVGFDNELRPYPGDLVIQDVTTLHGSQFRGAAVIVASPPCQAYSYRAMPWKRAKALPPPDNTLFEVCFRIQREASEAAGQHVPLIVENVCGAQPWVGRAAWHYGSFYLWGDVPALMPSTLNARKAPDPNHGTRGWFGREGGTGVKNKGGSWFAVAHNTSSGKGQNPVNKADGVKQRGNWWHDPASMTCRFSSRSKARKHASAVIAKIPFPLARHIAQVFKGAVPEAARV